MKKFLIPLFLLSLGACGVIPNTQINTIAKADAEWALADAKAHNDNALVPCYTQVDANAIADLAAGTAPTGILSTIQVARDECRNLQVILQACAPVATAAPLIYSQIVLTVSSACKQAGQ